MVMTENDFMTLFRCVFTYDYDIIEEYWRNMIETERKKWQKSPNEISDLETFFI